MQLNRQKLFSLILALSLVLLTVGCLQQGNLVLVDSNLQKKDQQQINPNLENIKLKFSQPVAKTQVNLLRNGQSVEVTVEKAKQAKVINIKGLSLIPVTNYHLQLKVQTKLGNQLQQTFSFRTTRAPYPKIKDQNKTIMQTFYWNMGTGKYAEKYPREDNLWKLLADRANKLAEKGITAAWVPPASKAHERADEGYAIYDPWDLGEFKQAGTVRTKYGTKQQLETALAELHQAGIRVYFDAVLNQRIAAGKQNLEQAPFASGKTHTVYTKLSPLKGRQKYYSKADEWKWNWKCFDGVDYTYDEGKISPSLFKGKSWDNTYDKDYLLGADVDYENSKVRHEMKAWGRWLVNDIGFDGFRIDAIKHIDSDFISSWMSNIQQSTERDIRFMGEAWIRSPMGLKFYLRSIGNPHLDLFDFGLRDTFTKLRNGTLNMKTLGAAGLVNTKYQKRAITFVDNHDTIRGGYGRPIDKRKLQAYTYILTQAHGTPLVFWKDYYISGYQQELTKLLEIRHYFAYGPEREAETNDSTVYSYVREGLENKPRTGLVMMITGGNSDKILTKRINTGQPNTTFYDYTGNVEGKVTTNDRGYGQFKVENSVQDGWSVWVPVRS